MIFLSWGEGVAASLLILKVVGYFVKELVGWGSRARGYTYLDGECGARMPGRWTRGRDGRCIVFGRVVFPSKFLSENND